ncbi:hypothetical protein XENTR_v10015874 [Xenopus tropicalis]|nr:hypothetical protein XENTR_v10015874 [Xenopus tropicalis]
MVMSQILRLLAIFYFVNGGLLNPLHSLCYKNISWDYILDPIEKMGKHLRDGERIVQILNESVLLFKKKNNPLPNIHKIRLAIFPVLEQLQTHVHHSNNSTVHQCFGKVNHFLASESNSRCAWEKVVCLFRKVIMRIQNCDWGC